MDEGQKRQRYTKRVLQLYLQLPETPLRHSRADAQLAEQLYQQKVKQKEIEQAMLLATARRLSRKAEADPLGPIRTLHYFLPVLQEVKTQPLPEDYIRYLRIKVEQAIRNSALLKGTKS